MLEIKFEGHKFFSECNKSITFGLVRVKYNQEESKFKGVSVSCLSAQTGEDLT